MTRLTEEELRAKAEREGPPTEEELRRAATFEAVRKSLSLATQGVLDNLPRVAPKEAPVLEPKRPRGRPRKTEEQKASAPQPPVEARQTGAASEYLRPKDAAKLVCMGLSTFWRYSATEPTFPNPIHVSSRLTVYRRGDLIAWMESRANPKELPNG